MTLFMTIHVVDLQNSNEFSLGRYCPYRKKSTVGLNIVGCLKVEKNLKKSEINVLLPIIFLQFFIFQLGKNHQLIHRVHTDMEIRGFES